jgi:hypothetical protein
VDLIIAAFVGAAIALIGTYIGPRLQAKAERAQWRRDRLLQFCADFLAASGSVVEVGRQIQDGKQPDYPVDAVGRLEHAYACICLLSDVLAESAHNHLVATVGLMTKTQADIGPPMEDSAKTRGLFLRSALNLLNDLAPQPNVWQRVQSKIAPHVPKSVIGFGVKTGLLAEPRKSAGPVPSPAGVQPPPPAPPPPPVAPAA